MLGYWEPETQREVWDANPDALIASSIALAAGRARKADGGFVVNGRWPFSSGVDNADWNMLAVTVYDGDTAIDWRLCLVPKSDYEIIDTWHAMGMAAPAARTSPSRTCSCRSGARSRSSGPRRLEHPGAALNRGALFGIRIIGGRRHSALRTPASIGAAEGAYEHFVAKRWPSAWAPIPARRSRTFQAVQIKLARARCDDRLRPRAVAQRLDRASGDVGARRGPRHGDQAALPRAVGLRGDAGARGRRDCCGRATARRASTRAIRCSATCAMRSR